MKMLFVPAEHVCDEEGMFFSDLTALKSYLSDLYKLKPSQLNFALCSCEADQARAIERGYLFAGEIYSSSDLSFIGAWTVVPDVYQFPRLRRIYEKNSR